MWGAHLEGHLREVTLLQEAVYSEKSASFYFYVSLECVHKGETPICTPVHP